MTSPIEEIKVICPKCGHLYKNWYRASANPFLDDFDDDYLDECASALCSKCKHKIYFSELKKEDGLFYLDEVNEREMVSDQ
jgi:hypothetical protein